MVSRRLTRIGLVLSAAVGANLACSRADVPMPPPIEEEQTVQTSTAARGFSVLGELNGPMAAQVTIPEQELQTEPIEELDEVYFLLRLDQFGKQYGFDVEAWQEESKKSPEEIEAILSTVPEAERSAIVLQFFSDVAFLNTVENFIKHQDYAGQDCRSGTSWYIHPERGLYCRDLPEGASFGAPTAYEDGLFTGTVEGEEVAPVLEQKRSELLERINEAEDAVEAILTGQLDESFRHLIGERPGVQLEFEVRRLGTLVVYDTIDDEIVSLVNYQKPLSDEAQQELDALFAEFPCYTYSTSSLGGLATVPAMILRYPFHGTATQHLVFSLNAGGHELTHQVLTGSPVKHIPGEAGSQIEETLAEIYGWQAAKDVVERHYTAEAIGDANAQSILEDLAIAFDEDGNFRAPRVEAAPDTDNRAEEMMNARYGGSLLGSRMIELYNCIGSPYDAFQLLKDFDSPEGVDEQLEICLADA